MADNNENFRMTKSETEHFIEQLKKPQDWTKQTSDKKAIIVTQCCKSVKNMDYIENCVVCNKYLETIALQDQGMCNDCDSRTQKIADEITKRERNN